MTRRIPAPEPDTPVSARRPPARRAQRPARAAAPPAGRSGRSAGARLARALGLLLIIGLLAAIVAGVVLLATDAGQLIKNEFNDQLDSVREFIQDYTE